jgi:hypothetical protein
VFFLREKIGIFPLLPDAYQEIAKTKRGRVMRRSGHAKSSQNFGNRSLVNPSQGIDKRPPNTITYAIASGMIASLLAYWPSSAADVPTRLNIIPARHTTASDNGGATHKADRLAISFEQRWSAVPMRSPELRGERKQPRAEVPVETVPFSCELAFSRLVKKGNFSTRCVASTDDFGTLTVG